MAEDLALCKLGLVGFPVDGNSSFMRGAADAPPLIRAAFFSDSSNLWTETGVDLGQANLFYDAGDVSASGSHWAAPIEAAISNLLERNLRPISLGGDHSVTFPIVRAIAKHHPRVTILHFDAHPDLYHEFQNSRHSHACPFARIMEAGLVQRLVQVGIRTMNGHQREQALRFGVEVHEMKDLRDELRLSFDTPVYISLDVDGFDPAYAPGVSHREPGGLTPRQVIRLIEEIRQPIVGADIVELNPKMDVNGVTAMLCAKMLKEIAGCMLRD